MALLKTITYKGLEVNSYIKIRWIVVNEWVSVEGYKRYNVDCSTAFYTSPTKEFELVELGEFCTKIEGLKESEINFATLYTKLKETDKFSNSIDS